MSAEQKTFGSYRATELIATGGTAEVWRARSPRSREVAVKAMLREAALVTSADAFASEAMILASLRHPNVVDVLDYGQTEQGRPFLVMELVDGYSLDQLWRKLRRIDRKLSMEAALVIGYDTCQALACAHAHRVVHRDVSPQNILIATDGTVKISDFGISRIMEGPSIEPNDSIVGKIYYLSPEDAAGRAVDERADLFSLGVVLYELLLGENMVELGEMEKTLRSIEQVSNIDAFAMAQIPEPVRGALQRILARNPDERFQSANSFGRCIARALGRDGMQRGREHLLDALALVGSPTAPPQWLRAVDDVTEAAKTRVAPAFHRRSSQPGHRRKRDLLLWLAAGGATVCALFAWLSQRL